MAERSAPKRRRVALALVALAAGAAYWIDAAVTADDVPPVPAACDVVADPACNDERNAEFTIRLEAAFELEDGLKQRYWVYAGAFIAAALGLTAAGLLGRSEADRQVLDDLGILGVAWLPAGVLLLAVVDAGLIDVPAQPLFAPAVAFIVTAGVGRLVASGGDEAPPERKLLGRVAPRLGLALLAAAVTLAAIVVANQGSQAACGTPDDGWVDVFRALAAMTGLGAAAAGIASLVGRRWIEALLCIVVGPIAALFALLAGICFS
jgi:hypothetical protein